MNQGRFVVVVGPDGVGKTTFARRLLEQVEPEGRYFHFRPPARGRLKGHVPDAKPLPKGIPSGPAAVGWVRLLVSVLRFWIGYLSTVRPELRRGRTVVADRWGYGYLVQPRPLGFLGPDWLARAAVAVLPRPDVVFNLKASPGLVRTRKTELAIDEIEAELVAWERIPGPVVTIDASRSPDEMVSAAMLHLT